MMEVLVTTGALGCAKFQSDHHFRQNITQLFTGLMPFLSPNQQCQSTEGKVLYSMDFLTSSWLGGFISRLWPLKAPRYLGEGCQASDEPSDASTQVQLS